MCDYFHTIRVRIGWILSCACQTHSVSLAIESEDKMIICSKCDDVLYTDTMPEGLDEIVKVMCADCAFNYTMEGAN